HLRLEHCTGEGEPVAEHDRLSASARLLVPKAGSVEHRMGHVPAPVNGARRVATYALETSASLMRVKRSGVAMNVWEDDTDLRCPSLPATKCHERISRCARRLRRRIDDVGRGPLEEMSVTAAFGSELKAARLFQADQDQAVVRFAPPTDNHTNPGN